MKQMIIVAIFLSVTIYGNWVSTPTQSAYEIPVDKKMLVTLIGMKYTGDVKLREPQRQKLVRFAKNYLGRKQIPKFRDDCSGFVRMVFYRFNVDIFRLPIEELRRSNGSWVNGTEVIQRYAKEHGYNYKKNIPQPGDFIYFDNTHDRNKNGRIDDPYTHIAIVTRVDSDGTIEYIHRSNPGVNIQVMNLRYPNQTHITINGKKKRVNSWLRGKSRQDKTYTPHYSAQMLRGFGSIFPKKRSGFVGIDRTAELQRDKIRREQLKKEQLKKEQLKKEQLKKDKLKKDKLKKDKLKKDKLKKDKLKKDKLKKDKLKNKISVKPIIQNRCIKKLSSKMRGRVSIIAKKYKGRKIKHSLLFVNTVYRQFSCDLMAQKDGYKGIEKVYWFVNQYGWLFLTNDPKPGDLIFFDNLHNKTRKSRGEVPFSDIGIVLNTDQNGTITFLHVQNGRVVQHRVNRRYWKQHKVEINRKQVIVNDYLRTKRFGDLKGTRYLAGEFYRNSGSLFRR